MMVSYRAEDKLDFEDHKIAVPKFSRVNIGLALVVGILIVCSQKEVEIVTLRDKNFMKPCLRKFVK